MNIAFDIDGVLTDFEFFLDTFGKKYFSKREKYRINAGVSSSSISKRFGYSNDWDVRFYTRYLFWYARKYPIRENAATVINTLRNEGNKIYLITARALADKDNVLGKLMRHCLKIWLKKNYVNYDDIYYVSVKNSAKEKCEICKKLNIDVIVEDEPTNIDMLKNVCRVICFVADYNKDITGCAKALDFGEVYSHIIQNEFTVLDYEEREKLNYEERKKYFEQLKQYYSELPFDIDYLKSREKNICIAQKWLKPVFDLFMTYGIKKCKELDAKANCIYVCNHRSSWDIPLCYCALDKVYTRVLIKRELEFSAIGKFIRTLGMIFVKREDKKSGKSMQNLMIQTLLNGGNILLFPEGTRNRTMHNLLQFKMGAVYMAQVTGVPIIPIVIKKYKRKYEICVDKALYIGVNDDLEECNTLLRKKMEGIYLKGIKT